MARGRVRCRRRVLPELRTSTIPKRGRPQHYAKYQQKTEHAGHRRYEIEHALFVGLGEVRSDAGRCVDEDRATPDGNVERQNQPDDVADDRLEWSEVVGAGGNYEEQDDQGQACQETNRE